MFNLIQIIAFTVAFIACLEICHIIIKAVTGIEKAGSG